MYSRIILLLLYFNVILGQNQVEVRRARRPNRIDHLLCKQKNSGFGIRSSAVLNYSGEVCKTYCRVVNRVNRITSYVEYVSPNNIRCGPFAAKCIEGVCSQSSPAVTSGQINDVESPDRTGRPLDSVAANRRVRPGRRGTINPVRTTSLSTIELANTGTETATSDVVIDESQDVESIKAKIIFPND